MANLSPSITLSPNVNTNRDEMDLSPIRRAKLSPIRRAKLKKKRRILDSSNEDLSESTDCIPDLNESVNSNPTVVNKSVNADSDDNPNDAIDGLNLVDGDSSNEDNSIPDVDNDNQGEVKSDTKLKSSKRRVLQNSRYVSLNR